MLELDRAAAQIPSLSSAIDTFSSASSSPEFPTVSVIVPAYNEATNIQDCILSVLSNTTFPPEKIEVWVVDDRSTDATLALARSFHDPRLHVLPGEPCPTDSSWIGKNWACVQGARHAKGEFLLFIDADVRLKSDGIATLVQTAQQEQLDLLNPLPALVCRSWAEWLIQPLMFNNLLVAFHLADINQLQAKMPLAMGAMMLFRRSSYEQIGGHQAVSDQVAEDVALAQLIKRCNLNLKFVLAPNLAQLRMYQSWSTLWEGWTKVLYSGAYRNFLLMLCLASVMVTIYPTPWLGLAIILIKRIVASWSSSDFLAIAFVMSAILLQYCSRYLGAKALNSTTQYWWTSGFGGLLIAVIAITSVIKTKTGWGWTWRGRSLVSREIQKSDRFPRSCPFNRCVK